MLDFHVSRFKQNDFEPPKASVVVVTRNRDQSLSRTLKALRSLEYPDFEVVVVDNDSTDSSKEVIKQNGAVYVFAPSQSGIGACRQIGVEKSSGKVIAFCDDDCVPSPLWLFHLARRLMSDSRLGLVGGEVINVGFAKNKQHKGRSMLTKHGKCRFVESVEKAEFFGNMNLAFRRDVIEAVGGYDPFFNVLEEIDLALRIKKLGYGVEHEPLAVLEHHYTGISHKRRQIFFGSELIRLYLCMKHLRPRNTKEWFSFLAFEFRLLFKELFRVIKGTLFAIRHRRGDLLMTASIEAFNKISSRVVLPWLIWRSDQSNRQQTQRESLQESNHGSNRK